MPNGQQQTPSAGASVPAFELPLPLERALFIRFWWWLSAVGVIVASITAGAWVLIINSFEPAAKDVARTVAETTLSHLESRTNAEETRITELAGKLTEKISTLTDITNSAIAKATSIEKLYNNSIGFAQLLDLASKNINNIAEDPSLQTAVKESVKESLSGEVNQLRLSITELQKPSALAIVTTSRTFGQVYNNNTRRTMIVIVTAYNNRRGNTMCGNVGAGASLLPVGGKGGNSTTTVQSSFIDDKFSASIAFLVPAGYFYNVTTDGGSETLIAWTEATL